MGKRYLKNENDILCMFPEDIFIDLSIYSIIGSKHAVDLFQGRRSTDHSLGSHPDGIV